MFVEVDQSGKFEQLNTHTVVACANGDRVAIFLSAAVKRRLVQKLRRSLVPRRDMVAIVFAVLVFILLADLKKLPDKVLIDEEYTGKDKIIKETIEKLLSKRTKERWKGYIRFGRIGKSSPAHKLAWRLHKIKKKVQVRRIKEQDVLRWWQ